MAFKISLSLSKSRKQSKPAHLKTAHNDDGSRTPSKFWNAFRTRQANSDHTPDSVVANHTLSDSPPPPASNNIILHRVPPRISSLQPIITPPPRISSLPPKAGPKPVAALVVLLSKPIPASSPTPKPFSKPFVRRDEDGRNFISFSALYEQETTSQSIPTFYPASTAIRVVDTLTAQIIAKTDSQEGSNDDRTRLTSRGDSSAHASSTPLWAAASIRHECRQKTGEISPVPSPSARSEDSDSTTASVRLRRIADVNAAAGNLWDLLENAADYTAPPQSTSLPIYTTHSKDFTNYASSPQSINLVNSTTHPEDFTTNYTSYSPTDYLQHHFSVSTSDYPCIPRNSSGMSRITEMTETTTVSLLLLSPLAEGDDSDSLSDVSLTDVICGSPTLANLEDFDYDADDDKSDAMSLASVVTSNIEGFF
ncbi:hypothetical protein CONPUDRAFT_166630 [Coniophora puteana RWD-64-598 SS2]|uniref:Uncharacterized protein n=1 Tax=Coniophora puteana (strain RWD-64-598) TaxID=741705 RepID=A0A5M3ML88_CONPW|nr:uncharacterized protein CONPUDRAFT_166630 [Coniophora puteana RWD-64-598 SS2]EIW80002.1 hypothetical protein CONPUDRAFT_166630 [Coniophora puteana RWD-64-598 SS2]